MRRLPPRLGQSKIDVAPPLPSGRPYICATNALLIYNQGEFPPRGERRAGREWDIGSDKSVLIQVVYEAGPSACREKQGARRAERGLITSQ